MKKRKNVKKVVLAYSGGLDTSIILKWLQSELGVEVVTFTADLGQGEELETARRKAEILGVKEIYIEDLREEFIRDFVFPMFRANAVYEGCYLLETSIARPLISKNALLKLPRKRVQMQLPMEEQEKVMIKFALNFLLMLLILISRLLLHGVIGLLKVGQICLNLRARIKFQ